MLEVGELVGMTGVLNQVLNWMKVVELGDRRCLLDHCLNMMGFVKHVDLDMWE